MSKVKINIIKGNEGYCLNLLDESNSGFRIAGNKPWGNPYNVPTASFEIDADELIRLINASRYD